MATYQLVLDERTETEDVQFGWYISKQINAEEIQEFTSLVINDPDGITWMEALRKIIQAMEEHYGYEFDLGKLKDTK